MSKLDIAWVERLAVTALLPKHRRTALAGHQVTIVLLSDREEKHLLNIITQAEPTFGADHGRLG